MEKQKKEPLKVLLPFSEQETNKKIEILNEALAKLQTILREQEKPADLADIMKYLSEGADWERRARIDECKEYIARNQMPSYMVGNALKNAADSVPQSFITRVEDICTSLEGFTAKDITELADGTVVLSQGYVDSLFEAAKYVYSPEREAQIPRIRALITEIRVLYAEGVDISRLISSYAFERLGSLNNLEIGLPLYFIKKPE